jgi:prephenate dehydrogenase
VTRVVAVIGLGLIGGSIAASLRRQGASVRGWDRSGSAATIAERRGLVDQIAGNIRAAVNGAGAVILATPVGAIIELLPDVDRAAPDDALILDTGSVKAAVVDVMASLPGAHRAVGGHPLAGSERSGPEAADPDLLRGQPFILCPSDKTGEPALAAARSLISALGMHPVSLPADKHDRILARTSHLPQFLATALALTLRAGDRELGGSALRDMTRLAASDPTMWRDIASTNRTFILDAIGRYQTALTEIAALISAGDLSGLDTVMRQAAAPAPEAAQEETG